MNVGDKMVVYIRAIYEQYKVLFFWFLNMKVIVVLLLVSIIATQTVIYLWFIKIFHGFINNISKESYSRRKGDVRCRNRFWRNGFGRNDSDDPNTIGGNDSGEGEIAKRFTGQFNY